MRPIVGGNFVGNIESGEYAVRIISGHVFVREAVLLGGPSDDEAGVPARHKDNFVLPVSTMVPRFVVGEYVRANGREWSRRDRMGARFALG